MNEFWIRILIAAVGLIAASRVNWAIYRWAYFQRNIGPWQSAPENCPPRTWQDCIPILGWIRLARESHVHGKGFWIRPMLIEILLPIVLVWMYGYWTQGGLLPLNPNLRNGVPLHTLRIQYIAHSVLFLMLVIATFIDFDEQSIPDMVTTPATLLALLGSALLPQWHLIYETPDNVLVRLQPGSPMAWNTAWDGIGGMWLGLMSFSIWCFAIADRRWITRRGLGKAIEYFIAGIFRYPTWKILFAIWVIGSLAIVVGFWFLSNDQWRSLFSSLIGMTLGCSIVWAIRVVARAAMRVEAMGFGDVTLMAMVGAFLGWQPAWMAFFLAPMIAVLIVLILSLITGNGMTPFGPYLAMATMLVLVFWDFLFNQYVMPRMLMMGDYWIWFLFAFLIVFGVVLWIWAQIKSLLFRRG